jgi:hypothetical protein
LRLRTRSRRFPAAPLVTKDTSDAIGHAVRGRGLFEPLASVPVENRDQRWVCPSARRVQQASREQEGVLSHREVHVGPKEARMLAGIRRGRVRKVDFLGRPIHARHDAADADPRRQQEFCGLTRGRRASGELVPKHRPVIRDLKLDPAGLVDQALIATEAFVRGTERRT